MNISNEYPEHTTQLLEGFESLFNPAYKALGSIDYLDTNLRINGVNLDAVKGTESFTDTLKKVGKEFYEMIRDMIRNFRAWLRSFGGSQRETKVKTAVMAVEVATKEIKQEIKAAPEEVVEKVSQTSEKMIERLELSFNVVKLHDRFIADKDGMFTDAQKAAESLGVKFPDYSKEFKFITDILERITKNFENHKVSKSGNISGVIDNVQDGLELARCYRDLRIQYEKILKPMLDDLETVNEVCKNTEKSDPNTYRVARKVTSYLGSFTNALMSAQASADKNVKRISESYESMLVQLTYESRSREVLSKFE